MNPLLRNPSTPIAFDLIRVEQIREAAGEAVEDIKKVRQRILQSAPEDKRRLLWLDTIYDRLDKLLSPVYLLGEVHEDEAIREACQEVTEFLFTLQDELNMDEGLYGALSELSQEEVALSSVEARFLEKVMWTYRRNGLQLGPRDRVRLKQIDSDLNKKEMAFSRNISDCYDRKSLREEDLRGVPQEFKQQHRREDGTYAILIKNPDYEYLLKYVEKEAVRKSLYRVFHNRAKEKNLPLMSDILKLRAERARLLGFESFADYALAGTMAKTPATVWRFLDELSQKILPKSLADYRALCRLADLEVMDSWDKFFYTKLYKQDKYKVADESIRPYFPLDQVLRGIFRLLESLFQIDICGDPDTPVWHPDVRVYRLQERGRLIARFYLDPYARPNKYDQAACFGLQNGKQRDDGIYQLPEAALVFHLSSPGGDKPCLLSHQQITSLFHEFGHLLHHLFTRSSFAFLSGSYVDEDFIEMPSQMMECWSWEKEILRACSSHYQTGKPIPDELVEGLASARYLNTGINTQLQAQFAAIDLRYHHATNPPSPEKTTELAMALQKKYNLYRPAPGTHPQASFNHFVGYASTYYGYLWSRVYASDLFSVFKEKGLNDREMGGRFREIVLASGNTREPMALIEQFLERAARVDAYLNSMGFLSMDQVSEDTKINREPTPSK